ncbi:nose resistant to fluoxetine protein 6-like [Macrosteles quadrilineatus]|uniref:nose resistant to fluoxetine protein 6-like n=1 Tax=Macrosteles quadrilineatus TaxID=74068 RepID=UPI0023E0C210|nr:nose resistant to fluoxetine protein 6-like [Macrosteles quadrilineatus]
MDPAASLGVFLFLFSFVGGQYDTLERRADKTVPPRLQQLRDHLVDRGMYQEGMFHLLSYVVPTDSDNPRCSNHSALYQVAVLSDQPWAQRMVDASSKIGDGFLQGNIQGLGSYDECLGVSEPNQLFTGQLCIVQTKGMLPSVVHNPPTAEYSLLRALPIDLNFAVCLPSTCTYADVAEHWRVVAVEVNATATVEPFDCSVKGDLKPGARFWQALCVMATLFALVFLSSWYDWAVNYQPAKSRRMLVSFSMFNTWQKLSGRDRQDSLDILDGLRVLAISWIILGHRFEMSLQVPNLSLLDMERYTTAWFMSPILNMMLGVEVFFLISGCFMFTVHDCMVHVSYPQHDVGCGSVLPHLRLFAQFPLPSRTRERLTPALVFVMMMEGCVLLHVSDGPLWKRLIGNRALSCVENWWLNLFYISNYVNPYHTCMIQSWYLSADMQLYLIAPLLLIPLARSLVGSADRWTNKGLVFICFCYIATTAASFANAFYFKLPAGATVSLDKKTEQNHGSEYVVTHVRAASWLTGMALGYVIHLIKKKQLNINLSNRMAVALCWSVSLFLCLAAVFSIVQFQSPQHQYHRVVDSLHIALHRNVFSLGIAGVVLLCVLGKGGPVQSFLGWRIFRPLATLSYGVYLSHMGLQALGLARIRQPLAFDMFTLVI